MSAQVFKTNNVKQITSNKIQSNKMSKNKNIQKEVEKTLSSLDDWRKIKTDPYFYTRLSVKIENRGQSKRLVWFFDSPILRPALIAIALLVNVLSISYYLSSNNIDTQSNDLASLFAEEYMLDMSTESYLDFNIE